MKKKKVQTEELMKDETLDSEPTIDGKKLSEVFDIKNKKKNRKAKKEESSSSEDFEINFDPNADVKVKKKKSVFKIIGVCIAWFLILVVGGVGGWIVGDMIVAKLDVYDPNAYSADALRDSEEVVLGWKKKSIASLTAVQVFAVAEYNLNNCTYFSMTTKGLNGRSKGLISNSVAPQDFWGYRYRNGDVGYFDYNSSGIMAVVKTTKFNYSGGKYTCIDGVSKKTTEMTPEEYVKEVGCEATRPIDYIVSSKTVLTEKKNGSDDGKFTYTITIDASKSVVNYVKKMKYMSGLADYPKFKKIQIEFTVDSSLNFQSIEVHEEYTVNYGLTVGCTGEFRYEFSYKDIKIK